MTDVDFTMAVNAIMLYASFAYMFGAFVYALYEIYKERKKK